MKNRFDKTHDIKHTCTHTHTRVIKTHRKWCRLPLPCTTSLRVFHAVRTNVAPSMCVIEKNQQTLNKRSDQFISFAFGNSSRGAHSVCHYMQLFQSGRSLDFWKISCKNSYGIVCIEQTFAALVLGLCFEFVSIFFLRFRTYFQPFYQASKLLPTFLPSFEVPSNIFLKFLRSVFSCKFLLICLQTFSHVSSLCVMAYCVSSTLPVSLIRWQLQPETSALWTLRPREFRYKFSLSLSLSQCLANLVHACD